jgi:hypothetical protein
MNADIKRCLRSSLRHWVKLAYFLGIDKTIFVGNYPVSTSIWTSEQEAELPAIAHELQQANPDYYVGICKSSASPSPQAH